jgi:hypothetical protein
MNVLAVIEAAKKHYKIMLGSCGCSICRVIRAPKTNPDYEELMSYNKIEKPMEPREPYRSPTKEWAQRGIYKPLPQPPKAI